MLIIDGAYGEGGGQILRTALALAALLTRPVYIDHIRAGRKNPGLAAQHLTAVQAAAMICDAAVTGAKLGSTQLSFEPQCPPLAGLYEFDVAQARAGGSAGAATLVLQTVLLPLACAGQASTVTVKGGTHVAWSPPFHYFRDVYLPLLAGLGIEAAANLSAWGWYPAGGGAITLEIAGGWALSKQCLPDQGTGFDLGAGRGSLKQISGAAVAADLPAHIAQRMCNRALNLLQQADFAATIEPQRVRSQSPGAGIFLLAEYEAGRAGFSALGRKGKPSEVVAEEAVEALLAFHCTGAVVDHYLADQLVLPLALAGYSSKVRVERLSRHTLTNIWVVEQFLGPVADVDHQRQLIRFNEPYQNT